MNKDEIAKVEEDAHKKGYKVYKAKMRRLLIVYRERLINPELAHIALHIMHEHARTSMVPFEETLPESKEFKIPAGLKKYYTYSTNPGNRSDTTGFPDKKNLLDSYGHLSHANEMDEVLRRNTMQPLIVNNQLTRNVFHNDPGIAILKD